MPPLSLMIKPVSSACPLRCRYCFYADEAENRSCYSYGNMSFETLEKLVRRAMTYADGSVSFAFQGGEPTLAGLAFFREVVRLQKQYNSRGIAVQNAIQTNGWRIDRELLDFLVAEHFLIGISVDGTKELHDRFRTGPGGTETYDDVIRTAEYLEQIGGEFNILTVVNEDVAKHAGEVFRSLSKYRYLQFIPCLDPLDGTVPPYSLTPESYGTFLKETFDLYYEAIKKERPVSVRNFDNYLGILLGRRPENCAMCGRCGTYYLIEGDGSVFPCDFYVLDRWKMGNINDQSFYKLEKSEIANDFRRMSVPLPDGCGSCEWFGLCRGGCRRDREPFADGKPAQNRWCASYKAFFEYAFPRMKELALLVR
ncbi:MAG: anaerobic sulfatase maturase [Firmicutes bacterium]|nr:anaerobic sulfatase maturase [Bacillota bacterium]